VPAKPKSRGQRRRSHQPRRFCNWSEPGVIVGLKATAGNWFRSKALETGFIPVVIQARRRRLLCTRGPTRPRSERVQRTQTSTRRTPRTATSKNSARASACSPFLSEPSLFAGGPADTIQQSAGRSGSSAPRRNGCAMGNGKCNMSPSGEEVGYNSLSHSARVPEMYGCCPCLYPMHTPGTTGKRSIRCPKRNDFWPTERASSTRPTSKNRQTAAKAALVPFSSLRHEIWFRSYFSFQDPRGHKVLGHC